jgi:hypothetical protein
MKIHLGMQLQELAGVAAAKQLQMLDPTRGKPKAFTYVCLI